MPRVEIPGIGIVRFPDNMSREDIMSQATAMQLEASKPLSYDARDLPTSELIKGGFSRGIEGLKGTAFDLLPALGATLIGKDNYAKEQLKEYSERMAAEEAINPTAYKSYKDVGSIGQAFDFAAETIGEVGPDIASFMLGTGIGTIAGKQIAKKSLESTIKKEANEFATKKGFSKEAKEDYAERLVARAKAGAIGAKANEIGANVGLKTGLYGTSLGINVPDIFNSIYQDTGELAPGIALTIGPLVAALDAYLPNKILDQLGLKGKEQLAARMLEKSTVVPITFKRAFAGEILKTGAGEALTEGTQEVLSKFASQLAGDKDPFFSSENVDQIITASLKGLVGGTVYGAPGAAFDARRIKEQSLRQPFTEEPPPITPLGAQQTQPDLFGEQGLATPYSARQDQALTPRQQDIEAMQQAKAMQQPPTAESPRFYQEQQAAQPSPGQQGLDLQGGMTAEQQMVAERDRQNQEMNQLYLEEAQQQVQQARERATIAKEILDEEIALTDERVRLGDIKRTEAERINLLLPIINNLKLGTEDSITLFQQALRSAGYNNLELTEAEQRLLQRADDVKTAIAASLQGELDLQQLEYSAANQLTPDITGIKEKGEKGPAGEPKPVEPSQPRLDFGSFKTPRAKPTPTAEAAPEAAPSTVLDANTLDSIDLPKQSGYYRQLVNKDMANPADQEAVRNILVAVRQNPNLSPSTKQAIESIAIQAFNALATQQAFLGPRGGILKGANDGRVRSEPTGGVSGAGVPVPSEQAPTEPTKRTRAPKQQRVDSTTEPVDKSRSGEELPSSALEPKKQITPPTPPAKKVAKEPESIPVNAYTKALRKRIGIVNDKLRTETDPTEKELLRDELEELKLSLSEAAITPDTSANNEVVAELGKLDEAEINALETHYGVARNSEEFLANIKEDVLSYVNKGASAVAKAIRDIIQKIANGLLSVAVVFNASALQPDLFNVPQAFAATRNVSISAPANVPMSDIAKTTYSLSAPVAIKNKQALFIADKPNGMIHMFDDKGQFIASSNALYGKQAGDILTEESRNKPIEKTTTVDKVTPAGTYELSFSKDLSGDYAGGYTLRFNDKKGDLGGIAVHSVYLGDIKEDRLKKLSSTNLADKKVSFGCVNTSPEFMLDEVLPRAGTIFGSGKKAMAVVIPDQQAMLSSYLTPLTEQIPGQRTTGRAAADLAAKEEQITDTEAEAEQRIEGRFRTGEGTGMDKADVQKYIANEIKGWKNAPPVKVIETENQLPKYLQEQIEKENIVNPKGVWDPRTQSVFLISSNLTNNHDATYTVLHEIMGHFGLQKILGSKFDKVMGDIYSSNKAVKDRADNKIANGMDKLVAVEEVLAEMAETATNPSLIQKVVNIIRQALRALGFNLDTFTNGEILQLLQDSRKFVTGTEGAPIGGNVKFGAVFNSDAPIFYSQLASMVAGAPKQLNVASKEQWAAWIKSNAGKNQVKEEEIEYSGVLDFLNTTSGKISREDLLEFLNQEGVQVDTVIRDQYATNEEVEKLKLLRDEAKEKRRLFAKDLRNRLDSGEIKLNQLISENSLTYPVINNDRNPNIKLEDEFARGYIKRAVLYRDTRKWMVMQNEDFNTYSIYDNSKSLDEPAIFINETTRFSTADKAREALQEFKLDMQNRFPDGGVDIYDQYTDLDNQVRTFFEKIENARKNLDPQYGGYTLGPEVSTNYAELILTLLPSKQGKEYKIVEYYSPVYGEVYKVVDAENNTLADDIMTIRTAEEIKDGLDKDSITLYNHVHWANVNNPLVHVRVNEKTDDKGNRVLFVEELQSDWGQEYAANKEPNVEILAVESMTEGRYYSAYIDGTRVARANTAEQARAEALEFWGNHIKDNVAKAPFVTDPRSYTALAIKRLLRYAADNGYDKISFISGIEAHKRFPKTQDGESTKKGMETHYDVRIPSVTKDIFKKLGINPNSRTEELTVRLPENEYNFEAISEDGSTNIYEKGFPSILLFNDFMLDAYFRMYGSFPKFTKNYYDPVTQEIFYKKGERLRSNIKLENAINKGMDLQDILANSVTPSMKVKIEAKLKSTTEPFFTIDLTPEATEKVKRGQAMFREGGNEFKMSDLPESGTYTLKAGTEIFHGAHKAKAEEIKTGGKNLSARPKDKSGGGMLYEGNLIWFGDKSLATGHSKSEIDVNKARYDAEAGIIRKPGEVFSTITDRNYKLISVFNYKFSKEQADILNEALGMPDYKRIYEGDSPYSAAYRAHVYGPSKVNRYKVERSGEFSDGLAMTANILGFDGVFDTSGIALTADNGIRLSSETRPMARFSTGAGATFRNNPAAPGVNGNDARTIFDSFADKIESAGILNSERADNLHEFIKNGIFGNARKALLYTLPVKPLTEEAKRAGLKMAPQFNTIIDEQSGYVNSLNRRIEPLVQRAEAWAKGAGQKQIDLFNKVVYDSTTLKADPTKLKKAKVSQADYDLVKNNYDKLGGAGKSLYVQIRDAYAEMYQEILDSIEDRINTFEIGNDAKAKIKQDILEKLAAKGRIDPYFALTRKGKYWLSYNLKTKRADGQVTLEPYIEAYTTERERTKQAALVEAEGATEVQKFSQISQYRYSRAPSGSFVNNMLNILELNKPKNMSKEESDKYNEAADEVMRLYLSTLPETSFAQSFQKRKETLGFKRDAIEAMRDRMYSTSQQLGRMRYSAKLNKLLEEMREYSKLTSKGIGEEGEKITPQDNKLMNDYISVLEKHAESINNPNVSNISRLINSLGFNYLLGLNISSAVINLGQVPMVVAPYLAGEHGWGETMSAVNRAYKLYLNSGYGKDARTVEVIGTEKRDLAGNITTPAEKVKQRGMPSISNYDPNSVEGKKYGTLIEQAQKQGQINQSQFYDILEVDGRKNFGSTVNAVTGFAFHHGDRINREVSMVAAYDLQLAKLKSQGKTGKEAEIEAANYAIYITEMTNGGVSAASSPLIAKGNIGRVLFMFKRYGVSMYYMLFKITREALKGETPEIRKAAMSQLAGVYGTSALFSGLQGVPMFGIAAMVYNLFADEDEDDMETATRKYVGEFAYKGMLNYVTGAEVASRFSLSDLIFRSNPTANSRTFEQGLLENIGGPAYGVMSRIKRGLDFMSEGNMERGVENILPSAISNLFKAYRFGTEGAQSLRGDPIVEDINAFSVAAQAMGFAPAEYVRQLEINSNLKGIEKNILQEKSKLLQKWNVATRMGDIEDANEYKEKLFELNKKHPDLKISEDTFQRSERAFKAATKRTVNGVQFSQKLYDEMMRNAAEYEK